jgi:2-succinyl-5-enolpyruvyl-6-hydroxy-3-cyclohexene-1-carboxylate synthase
MSHADALTRQIAALVAGLHAAGVREAVAAPGSRSTPLAILLDRHPGMRLYMHYDERGAAYFALGLARRLARPVAVVVTSGTAVANLMPATAEAYLAGVPLVLLTADRPPELQDVGAPQTMPQRDLFRPVTKWQLELAAVDETADYAAQALMAGTRAARLAALAPKGPVHLNIPVREPLLPTPVVSFPTVPPQGDTVSSGGGANGLVEAVGREAGTGPGVIVAGPVDLRPAAHAILALADRTGWPVFADPLSNLRQLDHPLVLRHYDLWMAGAAPDPPSLVVRFGPPPTSKPLTEWLRPARLVLVDERQRWRDGGAGAHAIYWVDDWATVATGGESTGAGSRPTGFRPWKTWDDIAARTLAARMRAMPGDFEGWAYWRFSQAFGGYRAVVVGSSMPVRDLDSFWTGGREDPPVYANRGANGIDGVVSTGLGVAAAGGPAAIVLGDLSFWHDVNGLLAARLHGLHATVLVINNDGGGIFSFLAQSELPPDEFERLFGTPHGLDLAGAARAVGARFVHTTEWAAAEAAVRAAAAVPGLVVVEWQTASRRENVHRHRALREAVAEALRAASR